MAPRPLGPSLPIALCSFVLPFLAATHAAGPREVEGGVYPLSSDGQGPAGTEQAGWPMPFATVLTDSGAFVTDSGGNVPAEVSAGVPMSTALEGLYTRIDDGCGVIDESTTGQTLALGTGPGTDCDVPAGASPGNTHAARTAFYQLNRMQELARGLLPTNAWLQGPLTAETNAALTCGATWNGSALVFGRGGGVCANPGELAAVQVHEWGHGMDDNDANSFISNPAEGIADLYAALRLGDSCIGRGFLPGTCSGYGDPCAECTGVRELDWMLRASGQPHDLAWIDANCSSGSSPCSGISHCEGAVYSEAVWDLLIRDLPGLYGMDALTARQLVLQLTFCAAGQVGDWYTCTPGMAGCNADSGYLAFLECDDDNGSLLDGTPHMRAIFDAFDRHGIACPMPMAVDSGCAGTPMTAPTLTAVPGDRQVELSWTDVGASTYAAFKADGIDACDLGKEQVLTTSGTSAIVEGLKNGREVVFVVVPLGPGDSCMGPASGCIATAPNNIAIFADSFESSDLSAWSVSVP